MVYIPQWLRIALYWISLLILILLFRYRHYFWAFAIIIAYIIYIYDTDLHRIRNELDWISEALLDKRYLRDRERESGFYNFMRNNLIEGKIKKSMSIMQIAKVIEEEEKRLQDESYAILNEYSEYYNYLYFNKDKANKSDTIIIKGFGNSIPTPKLILRIKKGKLVGWKEGG